MQFFVIPCDRVPSSVWGRTDRWSFAVETSQRPEGQGPRRCLQIRPVELQR